MEQKLSLRTKLAYGCGSFGNNLIYGLMTMYLMVFYTDQAGISAAAAGTLFLFARIWDAVTDPVMGLLADNTQTRWGRFRPYLLFVPVFTAGCTVLCFISPDFSHRGKLIFAAATYILWGMSFTAMDIPYWAMTAVLTEDAKDRNSVVMVPRMLAPVARAVVGMAVLPMVAMFGRGNDQFGYFYTALVIAVAAVIFTWITFFNCRETVQVEKKSRQTFRETMAMIVRNRPLYLILGGLLMLEAVYTFKNALPIYYLIYVLHAEDMVPLFMGLVIVFSVAGAVIVPPLSNRYGKKLVAVWSSVAAAAFSIIFYFTGCANVLVLFIFNSAFVTAVSAANIAAMSMLADTVEYGEWQSGLRAEGMIFAANTFKAKVAGALGMALGAYGLAAIHYVPNMAQTPDTVRGLHLLFTLVPGLAGLIAVTPLCFYDLTEDKYSRILVDLQNRRRKPEIAGRK